MAETARLAQAEKEAEAALRDYSLRNYPVVFDVTPTQVRTLAILFREGVRAEEIDAYLGLMETGVGLVLPIDQPGSLRRLRLMLDAVAQVGVNSNVGSAIQGDTRKKRIKSFADAALSAPSPKNDQAVEDFRSRVLRYPSLLFR